MWFGGKGVWGLGAFLLGVGYPRGTCGVPAV